jgi:hypothetical protein
MGTSAPPPGSDGGEGGGAPARNDPFDAVREAGFDEDTDWADLAAKVQYVDALTDPNRHFDTLENSLRQWGHLPEGASLSDMFSEEVDDDAEPEVSWGPPSQQQPQIIGYDAAGEPIFSAPPQQQSQQPQFDPQQFATTFEERLMSKIDQRIADGTQNVGRELLAQRMVDDVEAQMERAQQEHNLNDNESAYLWNNVRARLATANIENISQVRGIVEAEWQQIEQLANARAAALVDPSKRPPLTTDISGPAPSREAQQPGQDAFGSMMGETARRLGISPDSEY